MLLTEMIAKEVLNEIADDYGINQEKLKLLADTLHTDMYVIENIANNSKGMIHIDILNRLFNRYRATIINPVKSSTIKAKLNGMY